MDTPPFLLPNLSSLAIDGMLEYISSLDEDMLVIRSTFLAMLLVLESGATIVDNHALYVDIYKHYFYTGGGTNIDVIFKAALREAKTMYTNGELENLLASWSLCTVDVTKFKHLIQKYEQNIEYLSIWMDQWRKYLQQYGGGGDLVCESLLKWMTEWRNNLQNCSGGGGGRCGGASGSIQNQTPHSSALKWENHKINNFLAMAVDEQRLQGTATTDNTLQMAMCEFLKNPSIDSLTPQVFEYMATYLRYRVPLDTTVPAIMCYLHQKHKIMLARFIDKKITENEEVMGDPYNSITNSCKW
jgi:hypothetical protein